MARLPKSFVDVALAPFMKNSNSVQWFFRAPYDYDSWVHVGMALYDGTLDDDALDDRFELWQNWS